MKYRTKSADVLNEADRFQTILDWRIFKEEQDLVLWGQSKSSWTPGDPIFQDPRLIFTYCFGPIGFVQEDHAEGYEGHHVRPMFQLLDEKNIYVKCTDCGVSWGREDECWMCGKVYKRPETNAWFSSGVDLVTFDFEYGVDFASVIREGLQLELGREWAILMNESMTNFSIGMQAMSSSMRGFHSPYQVIDEVSLHDFSIVSGGDFNTTPQFAAYWLAANLPIAGDVCTNPFAVEERVIELVRPVAADLTPVRERVVLPANVDLSGRVLPEMPQMPEARDWSEWTYEPTYGPPTTPINRRRG